MPANTVYVGRPTKWGNPYRAGDGLCSISADAVCYYEAFVEDGTNYINEQSPPEIEVIRRELRGKDLACWCARGAAVVALFVKCVVGHVQMRVDDDGEGVLFSHDKIKPRAAWMMFCSRWGCESLDDSKLERLFY